MSDSRLSRIKEQLRRLPHKPGVYLMKDRLGQIIYVGKAKDLKKRVSTYFQASRKLMIAQPKVRAMIDLIHDFDTILVKSEAEALLLESQLIKKHKPRYNTVLTDDKRYLLVRVDLREALPRFRLTRNRVDSQSRHFGPFAHSGHLRTTLAELRRKFGILLSDAKPIDLGNGRWRLYDDARAEIYEHPNEVTVEDYRERMEAACEFLEGKARAWLAELKEQMLAAAEARDYEKAASVRDMIEALERTAERTRKFERNLTGTHNHRQVVKRLKEQLQLPSLPDHMECFDISHISGSFCVASMVRFQHGRPDRRNYRRYKIKSFVGNDDFRAMEEVVGRRYRRLHDEGKAFPDLVVIDGGAGQVTAALKAFLAQGLEPPSLIGLAKKEETIIFSDGREPLNLSHHDPALRLLQHIRDEAHHFANSFNAELRSQRLRESILDDFKGLGPTKRMALLKHFGSLDKLRKADAEAITQVEGIGPKTAKGLVEFLQTS
ncbi:excinuclease ABC subunit UvrC [Coraliomargarita akajimensis]|uniref:Excinuclease ABC C subunit domain protein n=1 Tax=Coraliomargarita akajimensis (strain DSM 45221 / IAM 15411 / JCM 23193 / KCTC 12865 / 04OKA010-24) TaxID=583355 RepID=D5EMT4_CORAD|nr:excinuclease ABC subunit UvrC [Coraliomargarita akajimensis]ADE55324.1 excinuclease ABC C subunit domain protein [Coraliomargarita akajimensis DSM 45221]